MPMKASAKLPMTIGRFPGARSGRRSRNGSRNSSPMAMPGMTIVATGSSRPGKCFRSSNRLMKYHSGRGTYVASVGSAIGGERRVEANRERQQQREDGRDDDRVLQRVVGIKRRRRHRAAA